MSELSPGAYESLHTRRLQEGLAATALTPRFSAVSPDSAPDVLARHVADAVRRSLAGISDPEERQARVNQLIATLGADADPDSLVDLQQLVALTEQVAPGVHRLYPSPVTPLSDVALLTNTRGEPNMGAELSSELESADRVDLLCAFILFTGIRVIKDQLEELKDRGIPLRVLTTTYRGATQRRAVDELVNRYGAEVRIRYETQSTRLHAKAWLFHRQSGFDTGYVGSSNLSRSAMVDGLEWNVRISSVTTPTLVRKFEATFETYWNDPAFQPYDPTTDADKLDAALLEAGSSGGSGGSILSLSGLEVRALPHQEQMLEALDVERTVHDRHRNLLVAATGTGKTVVAALDYRNLCSRLGGRPSLLFVAHRKEILQQSLRTYREVLADGAFGEMYVDGLRPERWRHVFASVQALSASGVNALDPQQFDVVVIDEFHHAEAATYRRLLERLEPKELLGLTATPERSDGKDVRSFFDGRVAHELRLWDALDQDLLCPFHYYGVADGTDLSTVEWKRGTYDVAGLDNVYTGNDARTRLVLNAVWETVSHPERMRALGFCVSVQHARYMAQRFSEAGLPSIAVSAETPREERKTAFERLTAGDVRCLFAVDLFNEGLDLPDVDTLLLLRPTQSSTVFLQQLGRGLRRTHGKAVLTVLDFIGQQRREFRYENQFRALTGSSRKQLERDIDNGFPFLPSGSRIVLDRVAQQVVLTNVKSSLRLNQRREMIADVKSHAIDSLAEYLRESGHELADVYRDGGSWTALRRAAGFTTPDDGELEAALLKRLSALAQVDDPERAQAYRLIASPGGPPFVDLSEREQRYAQMLFFTLWPDRGNFAKVEDGILALRRHPAVCDELIQLMDVVVDRIRHLPRALSPALAHLSVLSHATYRREELLAGIECLSPTPRHFQAGVAWSERYAIDAFMVTLHKKEGEFSPSTMYRDYPISRDLFHWESQNRTSTQSPTGQRYLNHRARGSHVLIFVRDRPRDDFGDGAPYLCLGPVEYVEHRGERPIAITWKLDRPMPVEVLRSAAVATA